MPTKAATLDMPCSADTPQGGMWNAGTRGAELAERSTCRAVPCFHCGTPCPDEPITKEEKAFCCHGCLGVFELLSENGLAGFYEFGQPAGVRGGVVAGKPSHFVFVDQPTVRERLVDFSDARLTRVTFHVPTIHCIACVWLLENLFRLHPGLGKSQVNFPRRELAISFDTGAVRLSEVVGLLASLGYEPELKLSDLGTRTHPKEPRRLWVQLGVAGFAFGNTMLFSIASYLGLDSASGPAFQKLTGYISLLLAIPVVAFSAWDYWRSAWTSLRQRLLNIDVPIAVGILALFIQSVFEVTTGRGEGYFDSLTGLLFFLLCGRLFQQKTFDRLAFDRDFRSFFPLSVTRHNGESKERVALSELHVGDWLVIRNGELIPADARLIEGTASIDYSFVTGESEPVVKMAGDYLYAGGRQIGSAICVQMVKPVSQGYLTSLWNQEAFQKSGNGEAQNTLPNRYSQRFTKIVLGIAIGAAAFWAFVNPALSVKSFTSILIVACPCALALAAPFALGTGQRLLATRQVFLKNPTVLERLAAADSMVFDKTGTLTCPAGAAAFRGLPLTKDEKKWLSSVAEHSIHPLAARLHAALGTCPSVGVENFVETPGLGMTARVAGHEIRVGAIAWLQSMGARREVKREGSLPPEVAEMAGASSRVHVSIDSVYRGCFELAASLRPDSARLMSNLAKDYHLALLSGDNDRDRDRFAALLGSNAEVHFNQSPLDKLAYIRQLQKSGKKTVMIGDGLNDAGALKQSDVGIAVVENIGAFSPASDVILAAAMVPHISHIARFARASVRVVRASFLISAIYNVVGIAIAARGQLEPVVCAVLMPLSSVTVVAFACLATHWLGRRIPMSAREGESPTGSNAGRSREAIA